MCKYIHVGQQYMIMLAHWEFSNIYFEDVLKKWLIFSGYKVKHVMNITDVDDKTIKRSINEDLKLEDLTKVLRIRFFEDLRWLKIIPSRSYPRATDSISKIIEMN